MRVCNARIADVCLRGQKFAKYTPRGDSLLRHQHHRRNIASGHGPSFEGHPIVLNILSQSKTFSVIKDRFAQNIIFSTAEAFLNTIPCTLLLSGYHRLRHGVIKCIVTVLS